MTDLFKILEHTNPFIKIFTNIFFKCVDKLWALNWSDLT